MLCVIFVVRSYGCLTSAGFSSVHIPPVLAPISSRGAATCRMGADPTGLSGLRYCCPSRRAAAHPSRHSQDNPKVRLRRLSKRRRHDPFVYFHRIIDDHSRCDAHVVSLDLLTSICSRIDDSELRFHHARFGGARRSRLHLRATASSPGVYDGIEGSCGMGAEDHAKFSVSAAYHHDVLADRFRASPPTIPPDGNDGAAATSRRGPHPRNTRPGRGATPAPSRDSSWYPAAALGASGLSPSPSRLDQRHAYNPYSLLRSVRDNFFSGGGGPITSATRRRTGPSFRSGDDVFTAVATLSIAAKAESSSRQFLVARRRFTPGSEPVRLAKSSRTRDSFALVPDTSP